MLYSYDIIGYNILFIIWNELSKHALYHDIIDIKRISAISDIIGILYHLYHLISFIRWNNTFIPLLYGLKMIISAKRRDTSYIILKHACFLWDNCHNSMNNQYNWPLPSETDTSYILLKHYYTYYITIIFIMAIIRIISLCFCKGVTGSNYLCT